MNSRYDAIIVGARCAGASTAMLLARAGMKVLAVDRSPAGADTVSTHALMRGGVFELHRWGVLPGIASARTPPVRTTTFHYGDEAIEIAIKPKDGVDALYGPRRTVLDALLVDAARAAGAEVVHRVGAAGLQRDGAGRVRGVLLDRGVGVPVPVGADLVIGADGFRSRVARLAGSDTVRRGRHATAVIYGYFEGLEEQGFHWHYRPGVSVGVIPTNDGRTCVFVAMPPARFRAELGSELQALYRQVLFESSPALARRVEAARQVGKLWPFPGVPGHLRRAWGPGWALVGDAGFFRDPITAHGITDALRDAELLARAVVRGTDRAMADYEAARDGIARRMLEISDEVASFAWDLEAAKVLHLSLSRLMNAELELLRSVADDAAAGSCPYHGRPTSLTAAN
jgi:2-polyprenyl-6-methoxyphenol hydroxylase-like FAD-dependent oxidoreductase